MVKVISKPVNDTILMPGFGVIIYALSTKPKFSIVMAMNSYCRVHNMAKAINMATELKI